MNRKKIFLYLIGIVAIIVCIRGCLIIGPDLENTRWISFVVFYCVGDGKNGVVQGKVWSTEDVKTLDLLRKSYHERYRHGAMAPGGMKTNCIKITLPNRESWFIYLFHQYPNEGDLIDLQRVPDGRPSFHISIDPSFYHTLKKIIEKETGDDPHFMYEKEVRIKDSHLHLDPR